jgi:hypothetical protein
MDASRSVHVWRSQLIEVLCEGSALAETSSCCFELSSRQNRKCHAEALQSVPADKHRPTVRADDILAAQHSRPERRDLPSPT